MADKTVQDLISDVVLNSAATRISVEHRPKIGQRRILPHFYMVHLGQDRLAMSHHRIDTNKWGDYADRVNVMQGFALQAVKDQLRVIAVFVVADSWFVKMPESDYQGELPSELPNRRECVSLFGASLDGRSMIVHTPYERNTADRIIKISDQVINFDRDTLVIDSNDPTLKSNLAMQFFVSYIPLEILNSNIKSRLN